MITKQMALPIISPGYETKRHITKLWLFPPRFPDKDRFTSSRPDFVLVTPSAAKTQKQQTNVGGGFFGVAGGN